ncbi:hypothetical protein GCM10011492_39250 [Flexivirga endophytica]|uniref:Signal peptidase I n=1 Tax=Flexivirga endophytica TaxID=1849103 RepID=A0A916TGB7_9MICO|nr:signal peptidase I [Flexivirga endophytica]GGB44320.1 hypothetical protein GCM10011492_39250 [Flexivirga endophytica]GHB60224.1 hypothetical protein GCM10008112_31450 [Flexivirga endophytica]
MHLRRHFAWAFVAVLLLGLVGVGVTGWRQGYRAYVIHTGSMKPTLVPGDLIIDRPASPDRLQTGDIITFRHSAGPDLVTHRITRVADAGIHTKGDANRTADVWTIAPQMVQGVEQTRLPGLGYLAVYLKQPTGLASLATVLIALFLLWRLFFPPEEPRTVRRVPSGNTVPPA